MDTKKKARTNDLYCRDMPSAKAIEEIKHLAAVKGVKVGAIVHREHGVVKVLREIATGSDPRGLDKNEIAGLLARLGIPIV